MNIFLGILLLLAALFLIIAVLLQNGKTKGTGVVTGGAETFFGKNKAKSIDKKLSLLTTIVAIVFVILVIIVFVTQDYTDIFGASDTDSNIVSTDTSTGSDDLVQDIETDDALSADIESDTTGGSN